MTTLIHGGKTARAATLLDLATEANTSHRQARQSAESAVDFACRAGAALAAAKEQVTHGGWLDWLRDNCPDIAPRTAQRYIQLHRDLRLSGPNASRVSHLNDDTEPRSIRQALELVTEPKPKPERRCKLGPWREWPEDERRKWLASDWGWESFPRQTFCLSAMGWPVARIAALLLSDVRNVEAILNPVAPARFDSEANGRALFASGIDRVADAYRSTVDEIVAGVLRSHLWQMRHAEWEEIPDDVMRELNGIKRLMERRAGMLCERGIFRTLGDLDSVDRITLHSLAMSDARAALMIAAVEHPGAMTNWFRSHREAVREAGGDA